MLVTLVYTFGKTQQTADLKYAYFIVCKLYLNKGDLKITRTQFINPMGCMKISKDKSTAPNVFMT